MSQCGIRGKPTYFNISLGMRKIQLSKQIEQFSYLIKRKEYTNSLLKFTRFQLNANCTWIINFLVSYGILMMNISLSIFRKQNKRNAKHKLSPGITFNILWSVQGFFTLEGKILPIFNYYQLCISFPLFAVIVLLFF